MSWRRATQADLPRVTALLDASLAHAMFARSNLQQHGLDGEHPRSMSFWMNGYNILGISRESMFFPAADANADWSSLAPLLKGTRIKGALGVTSTLRPLLSALGHGNTRAPHDVDEPHFHLHLNDLQMPETEGLALSPITPALRDLAIAWRIAYCIETLHMTPAQATKRAPEDIASEIAADSHRILLRDDLPVATTGFNARTTDMVQIGGVYTPPELRGQHLARKALALHLREAQSGGATQSVLTAANPIAARAYTALGYHQIGTFTFWIPAEPLSL